MEMNLDVVHDIQKVYRKVLNAMSRPGTIENVRDVEDKFNINMECYRSTYLIMLMVLDGEESFCIKDNEDVARDVTRLTGAKNKASKDADYIFVLNSFKDVNSVLKSAKIGTLIDPQKSATIIVEVDSINNDSKYVLKGPGIKTESNLSVSLNNDWVNARDDKNKEYPLGIDMIFTDKSGNIACIPRTTKIKEA